MAKRLLTTMVGLPILLLIIWAGLPWLTILVAAVSFLGLVEFRKLAIASGAKVPFGLMFLLTSIFIVNGYLSHQWGNYSWAILILGAFVSLWWTRIYGKEGAVRNYIYTLLGPVCIGFLLSHALLLRGDTQSGLEWLYFALLTTFASDSGAFFVGRLIGRHKLAPELSPRKTWEGSMGALLLAVASALTLYYVMDLSIPLWQLLVLGVIIGIVGQIGDLLESVLKRKAGAKDSGILLPGHGGILDRLDSTVFNIPVVYYSLKLLMLL